MGINITNYPTLKLYFFDKKKQQLKKSVQYNSSN